MISTAHQTRPASLQGLKVIYSGPKAPTDMEVSRAVLTRFGLSGDSLKGTYIRAIRQGWGDNLVLSYDYQTEVWILDEIFKTIKK